MLKAQLPFLTNLTARAIPLAVAVALAAIATAQGNLVPNPSFEDTVNCEVGTQCQLLKATGWYNPNTATPDVWDCDLIRECGVPMDPNDFGFQNSYDGLRHAGAYFWFGPGSSNSRDYLMVQLASEMTQGAAYRIALNYSRRDDFIWATDHIGVWIGSDSVWENTPNWLNLSPQVKLRDPNSTYLTEANAWVELADTLFASGGEEWMIIGNFDVADSVQGIEVMPNGWSYAYYYIDQVSLVHLGEVQAVPEQAMSAWWIGEGLRVEFPEGLQIIALSVFDASGRMVHWQQHTHNAPSVALDLPELSNGLYVLHAEGETPMSVRFVKGE